MWSDLKLKVKRKLQHNQTEVKATGGGPNRLMILSTYEEAVGNLLSFQKTTNHEGNYQCFTNSVNLIITMFLQTGPSFGFNVHSSPRPQPSNSHEDSSDDENDVDLGATGGDSAEVPVARTPVTPRRPTPRNYRQKLLEVQTDHLRELVENSRESLQLQRDALVLQKEKLKLKKECLARAEKQRADELQFQLQVLEYKKMKLDLRRSNSEL